MPSAESRSLTTGGIQSTLLLLALPAFLEQCLNFFIAIFDAWLSGRISAAATTAVGLGSYVSWFAGMAFRLVGIGAAALLARSWGAGDIVEANRIANRALALSIMMGAVVSAFLAAAASLFVDLVGLTGDARQIAVTFLRLDAACYIFMALTQVGSAVLRASGDTRTPMIILAVVSVLNSVASYGLVYGLGPLPKVGVNGIVIGTMSARIAGGLIMAAGFVIGFRRLKFRVAEFRIRDARVSRMIRIGAPAAIDGTLFWVGMFAFLAIVSRVGGAFPPETVFAAHIVGIRIEAMSYLPADAWGAAAATMVGQALGAGLPNRARKAGHAAALQCGLLASLMSIVYFTGAPYFFASMHADPDVGTIGVPALRMLSLFQVPLVLCMIYIQAMRGAGDTRYPLLINLTGIYCVRLPLALLCGIVLHGGLIGAWVGMCADIAFRAAWAAARYSRGRWMRIAV